MRRHVPALDGVRGIAILLVLASHTPAAPWTRFGWCGVDLFFVLSGFLITGILLDTKDDPRRGRTFYIRRALRIAPLYYALLVVVLLAYHSERELIANQAWLWTYTMNWRIVLGNPSLMWSPVGHFWSLAIEEQFYLIWPLVVWRTAPRTAIRVAWIAIAGALVCRVLLLSAGAPWPTRYFLTPCRLDALGVGALVALWLRAEPADRVARRMRRAGIAALIVLAGVVAIDRRLGPDGPLTSTIGYSALAWLFGWLVTVAFGSADSVLRWPILTRAGLYSYGLYLLHPFVTDFLTVQWPQMGERRRGALMWIGAVALAWVSYHAYEQWFLRLKSRLAP